MPEPRSPGRRCRVRPKNIAAALGMHDWHRARRSPPRSGSMPAAPGRPEVLAAGRAGHVTGIVARDDDVVGEFIGLSLADDIGYGPASGGRAARVASLSTSPCLVGHSRPPL